MKKIILAILNIVFFTLLVSTSSHASKSLEEACNSHLKEANQQLGRLNTSRSHGSQYGACSWGMYIAGVLSNTNVLKKYCMGISDEELRFSIRALDRDMRNLKGCGGSSYHKFAGTAHWDGPLNDSLTQHRTPKNNPSTLSSSGQDNYDDLNIKINGHHIDECYSTNDAAYTVETLYKSAVEKKDYSKAMKLIATMNALHERGARICVGTEVEPSYQNYKEDIKKNQEKFVELYKKNMGW